jgi:hypothetical protein
VKKSLGLLTLLAGLVLLIPVNSPNPLLTKGEIGTGISITAEELETIPSLNDEIRAYLESKDSPLASHTDLLLEQEHWKLIIAISAIESSYCKRQLGNNCWGITNSSGGYSKYDSLDEAIVDANDLITRWQARGRWHSVEDMDGHYVVPANPNWVAVVTSVLSKLNTLSCHDHLDSNKLNQPEERCP